MRSAWSCWLTGRLSICSSHSIQGFEISACCFVESLMGGSPCKLSLPAFSICTSVLVGFHDGKKLLGVPADHPLLPI